MPRRVDERVRNKLDDTIRAVAETGGVMGISIHGFMNWDGTREHPPTLANFVRHAKYVADLVGVDHVGIGTDFTALRNEADAQRILDMSKNSYPETGGIFAAAFGNTSAGRYPPETPTPRQFPRILAALRDGGFTASEVEAIGGGNFSCAPSAPCGASAHGTGARRRRGANGVGVRHPPTRPVIRGRARHARRSRSPRACSFSLSASSFSRPILPPTGSREAFTHYLHA
jgi:hypothetical protein